MFNFRLASLLAAVVAIAIVGNHFALAGDDPVLTKVIFRSHTNDDDKDHDTGVYVVVKTADGQTQIAHADNRDNSGDDGTQYKCNSDHEFGVDVDADGIKKSACGGFKVHVTIHSHGYDTWRFNGQVILKFSDGTNLTANINNAELRGGGDGVDFNQG
jgi:hypothetical protein